MRMKQPARRPDPKHSHQFSTNEIADRLKRGIKQKLQIKTVTELVAKAALWLAEK